MNNLEKIKRWLKLTKRSGLEIEAIRLGIKDFSGAEKLRYALMNENIRAEVFSENKKLILSVWR